VDRQAIRQPIFAGPQNGVSDLQRRFIPPPRAGFASRPLLLLLRIPPQDELAHVEQESLTP
jgi:hypothetical protein